MNEQYTSKDATIRLPIRLYDTQATTLEQVLRHVGGSPAVVRL